MNRDLHQSVRLSFLLLSTCCLLAGCGDFRNAAQNVGAKVSERSSDETIRKLFESANAACPTRMDAFTTLENVEMLDNRRVEFRYLVNDEGRKIASRLNKNAMRQAAVDHMRGNPMAIAIAERDLSIEHIYEDSAGNRILSYAINRAVLSSDVAPVSAERSNPPDATPVNASAAQNVVAPKQDDVDPNVKKLLDSVKQEVNEPSEKTPPPLPQLYEPPRRTKDNPAGVQSNPYVDKT